MVENDTASQETNSFVLQSSKNLHQCHHCDYYATTAYNLKVHINNRHTNEVKYQCNQCEFFSYTKASLNYHTKSHNINEYQTCPECSYSTHSKSGLQNHIKTHQKERPFQCPHCPYAAARKMTLKEHMQVLHNACRDIYSCDQCSFKTNWARALKKHVKIHNSGLYNCSRCNLVFNSKQEMMLHESQMHNIQHKEYYCSHCQFCTDQLYKLQDHIHKRHGIENGRVLLYSCPECDYKTKWKRLIKGHRRVHTGELFRCDKCDFATITKTRLNEHLVTHLDMSERSFPCPHCPYRATRQTRLNDHITNRHYPQMKTIHKCDKCEFTTLWKSYLKVHMKMHTGEVFKCGRCSYVTPVKSQLLRHVRSLHKIGICDITSGNNNYRCPHCTYAASRRVRLDKHLELRHNNNKLHRCPICDFKTSWKNSLTVHLSVHRDEYLSCTKCSFKTLDRDVFKNHFVTHVRSSTKLAYNDKKFSEPPTENPITQSGESSSKISTDNVNYIGCHNLESDALKNDQTANLSCDRCNFVAETFESLLDHHMSHIDKDLFRKPYKGSILVYKSVTNGATMPRLVDNILYWVGECTKEGPLVTCLN